MASLAAVPAHCLFCFDALTDALLGGAHPLSLTLITLTIKGSSCTTTTMLNCQLRRAPAVHRLYSLCSIFHGSAPEVHTRCCFILAACSRSTLYEAPLALLLHSNISCWRRFDATAPLALRYYLCVHRPAASSASDCWQPHNAPLCTNVAL